jgi:hypothetical protein
VGVELLIVLAVVVVVAVLVTGPLRARARGEAEDGDGGRSVELADLEAAKEAKYREIRDAELDYRTGKLSEEDWRALDNDLRAEAVALLRHADRVRDRGEPVG